MYYCEFLKWVDFGVIWPWTLTLSAVLVVQSNTHLCEKHWLAMQQILWGRVYITQTAGVGWGASSASICAAMGHGLTVIVTIVIIIIIKSVVITVALSQRRCRDVLHSCSASIAAWLQYYQPVYVVRHNYRTSSPIRASNGKTLFVP